jgi:hypothetical protein
MKRRAFYSLVLAAAFVLGAAGTAAAQPRRAVTGLYTPAPAYSALPRAQVGVPYAQAVGSGYNPAYWSYLSQTRSFSYPYNSFYNAGYPYSYYASPFYANPYGAYSFGYSYGGYIYP